MRKKRAFTLMEMMMVVTIIGILAVLGMVNYTNIRERALMKEAVANLRLIAAAERTLRMETGVFQVCANAAACNTLLRLGLTTKNFTYRVSWVNANDFGAEAFSTRTNPTCNYRYQFSNEPNPMSLIAGSTATCPQPVQ